MRTPQLHDYGESQRYLARFQLAWLDAQLKDQEFIAAPRFTIADIPTLAAIDFALRAGITLDTALKDVTRWYHAISSRPSPARSGNGRHTTVRPWRAANASISIAAK